MDFFVIQAADNNTDKRRHKIMYNISNRSPYLILPYLRGG